MIHTFDYFRQINFAGVVMRLVVAMFCGGIVGLERERKHGDSGLAGMRTYMLVCVGAALTIEISQYEYTMLTGPWSALAESIGIKTDVSRFGAQVINGIGFLGAGTIIVTGSQEVKGLTTAAGLWASACMGLAVGAGFYEAVILAVILIIVSITALSNVESKIIDVARNMNFYVEYNTMDDISGIIAALKHMDARIYEVDIDRGDLKRGINHSAVFNIRLNQRMSHTALLMDLSQLDSIITIYEI
jgi:putative Mg2+ transporter-C (MgtC) family protein